MYTCDNCFSDKELKAYIQSSGVRGDCDICNSSNVYRIDLIELLDFFQELIDNFRRTENGQLLKSKIQESWSFFSSHDNASKILNFVIKKVNTEIESATDLVDYTEDIIANYSYWDTLKDKVKWKRRFLSDLEIIQELGWDGFFNTQFELSPEDKLYRARVHHQSGMSAYAPENMLCPEPSKASGGRANPSGIPFLYLSDKEDTVLYEVRASYLDEISIGEFHLKEELDKVKIVDFTEDTVLFQPGRITNTIKSRLLREKISRDLSKPMRRYDSEIEYIPTQFICEYIKVYTGANGIRFSSSLDPEGNNLVIFDQSIMQCSNVIVKKVNYLDLSAIEIKIASR
ncbi:MAG: RES family NAD+ phosphorylase [Bacteroidales bacterium]|nr:RES family NAD+ phosphorylase [Bacteroidales bacterium]